MDTGPLLLLLTATLLLLVACAWVTRLRGRLKLLAREAEADAGRRAGLRAELRRERAVRHELDAALASMSDAVLAVGLDGRVLRINRAAGRLLALDPDAVRGLPLGEVARDTAIHRLFEETLAGEDVADRDLRLAVADQPLDRPRHLSARTAVLRDGAGAGIGALAVLRDVTELRRLEAVRRDFVANVSHELKTPVAAIKAAVETLIDLADPAARPDPAATGRFLPMVARHADRLDAIIEDLLSLARLEGPGAKAALTVDWVGPVLAAAADACRPAATEAGVELEVSVTGGLLARMQPNLVEQAVTNLIENAVKYAASGGVVRVAAEADGDRPLVRIRVSDRGPGIDARHLPRLFERFYRADASRSRSGGGTGLGLSIVRHVAEACGGSVAVASTPGVGTTFTLTLQGPPSPEPAGAAAPEPEPGGGAATEPAAPAPPAPPASSFAASLASSFSSLFSPASP